MMITGSMEPVVVSMSYSLECYEKTTTVLPEFTSSDDPKKGKKVDTYA